MHKKYLFERIVISAVLILIFLVIIVSSIISIKTNGFKSWGIVVIGGLTVIIFLWLISLLIEKLFPKSKVGVFIKGLAKELLKGLAELLYYL